MWSRILRNKRADIPVTLLVLGVLAVCTLAVVSFIISRDFKQDAFLQIEVFERIHADVEKFYFFRNLGFGNEEAVEMVNQHIINTVLPERDNLALVGNQLVVNRSNKIISIMYTKNLD